MNNNIDQEWDTFSESSEDRMRSNSPADKGGQASRSASPYQAKGGRSNYCGGGGGYGGYGRPRPPTSHSKYDIMRDIDNSEASCSFWLNLFSLDTNVSEDEILRFYERIPAISAHWHTRGRPSMDVEFETRDDLVRAIDMGTCEFGGVKFCIRASKLTI